MNQIHLADTPYAHYLAQFHLGTEQNHLVRDDPSTSVSVRSTLNTCIELVRSLVNRLISMRPWMHFGFFRPTTPPHVNADEVLWKRLNHLLTARYKYIRELNLVSIGFRLQPFNLYTRKPTTAPALPSHTDYTLDHRQLLGRSLYEITVKTGLVPSDELETFHSFMESQNWPVAEVHDLLIYTRFLVTKALKARLADGLIDLFKTLELQFNSSDPLKQAPDPQPDRKPATSVYHQLHSHLYTMTIKASALVDLPADSLLLNSISDDVQYLTTLMAQIRAEKQQTLPPVPAGPVDPIMEPCYVGRTVDAFDSGECMDVDAWEGQVTIEHKRTDRTPRSSAKCFAIATTAADLYGEDLRFMNELKSVLNHRPHT